MKNYFMFMNKRVNKILAILRKPIPAFCGMVYTYICLALFIGFYSCGNKDENKPNFQVLADKEKELNDREARIKLKEIELEEKEKKLGLLESRETGTQSDTSSTSAADTSSLKKEIQKSGKKEEIQKEMSRKFENPAVTVRDYFEYIQRAINEKGNFDANMTKAQKYFPSRSVEKLKNSYRKTNQFTILEEPKVVSQDGPKSTVKAKVKQVELVNTNGQEREVTRTLSVTYSLKANADGQWSIMSVVAKAE